MINNDCFFENCYSDDVLLSSERNRVIDTISKSVSTEIVNHFNSYLNINGNAGRSKALK